MSYLGIDVGTSSVKVGILRHDGFLEVASRPVYGADRALALGELDSELWWDAACQALADLGDKVALRNIEAVAVIGNTPTLICVGEHGEPLAPAMLWSDTRAEEEAWQLRGERSQDDWNVIYGGFMPVSAAYPSAKLRWMERHWPHVLERTAKIIQPKDFVNYHLTSVLAGDMWTSKGLISLDSRRNTEPLSALGLPTRLAPPCYRPIDRIGYVTQEAGSATSIPVGIPVMAGWSDTLGAVLALGLDVGDAFILSGTSDSIGILTKQGTSDTAKVLSAPIWDTGYFIVYGPTSSGVSTLRWAETALGTSLTATSSLQSHVVRVDRPVFVPYILGQRSPIWNDRIRGAWLNVDIDCTQDELGDAVV